MDDSRVIFASTGTFKINKNPENRLQSMVSSFNTGNQIIFDSPSGRLVYNRDGRRFLLRNGMSEMRLSGPGGNMGSTIFNSPNAFRTTLNENRWIMLAENLVLGQAGAVRFPLEEEGQFFQLEIEAEGAEESEKIRLPKEDQKVIIPKSALQEVAPADDITSMTLHYVDENNSDQSTPLGQLNLKLPDEAETREMAADLLAEFLELKKEVLESLRDLLGHTNDLHFPEEDNFNDWLLQHFNVRL